MSALLKAMNAAEGLPRRRFTVDEVYAMTRAGILAENERIELIGGELVPIQVKGSFHERFKGALNLYWAQRLPPDLLFITETTLRLSVDTYLEPDFVVYPKAGGWTGLNAATVQPVVEIADSSLAYDLGCKAELYAGFGIVELWVTNAITKALVGSSTSHSLTSFCCQYSELKVVATARRACEINPVRSLDDRLLITGRV